MNNHISLSKHASITSPSSLNDKISIPRLEARDLHGNIRIIPDDFLSKKTLLFFAFKREQQCSIDSWVEGLRLRSSQNKITWIEIPLLQKPWKLLSSWIDHGMKRGITDHELRGHVWTTYTNRASFLKKMGLNSAASIYISVALQNGSITSIVSGDYTPAKAEIILQALQD